MSDTPRTCAQTKSFDSEEWGFNFVEVGFAETLERELNAITEERDELREEVNSLKESIRDQEHHIMELERLRRYSPGPHMWQD